MRATNEVESMIYNSLDKQTLVAGDAFVGAAESFRWYLLAMVFTIASAPTLRAMIALGRPGTLFLFDLATVVLLAGMSVVCVHIWGLVGISIALLAHRVIQFAWSSWLVTQIVKTAAAQADPAPSSALP